MKRCFGYVRVSTLKQGDGVSLDAQRAAIEQFAERNAIEITQWFEEKQTAAKGGRPIFGAMLKALRSRKADGVVMHKIDRSARNFADWAKIGDLADAGIDVHFATETLDFRSRGGRLSADIQAVIAADYIRNLRDETLKGMYGRLKQGLCPWGAPLGYLDKGKGKPKTPDPVRAPFVRELFELYATGTHSIPTLQLEMKRRGLRNRVGKPVSLHGIETMLANPFYCGLLKLRSTGEVFKGCHEPLVRPSVFECVQFIKSGKSGKKVTRHNHTYHGLFFCAYCSLAMIPERQKGRVYYRCHTPACVTKSIREDQIDGLVHAQLQRVVFTDEQIAEIERVILSWPVSEGREAALAGKQLLRAQIGERLDRLTDALIDRIIDQETYAAKKRAMMFEREKVDEDIAAINEKTSSERTLRQFLELAKSLAELYVSATSREKRQIVELTTSNREVAGKNLALVAQTWLGALQDWTASPGGDPYRSTSRTFENAAIEKLIEASVSKGATALAEFIEARKVEDADMEHTPVWQPGTGMPFSKMETDRR